MGQKENGAEFGLPFDFRTGLPTGLVLAKPIEQLAYDESILTDEHIATRKWNGWRIITTVTPSDNGIEDPEIRMFTDGKQKRVEDYVPHIVQDLKRLHLPPWTVLVSEAILEQNGVERLGDVGKILPMKNAEDAINKQQRIGRLKLILHGIMCWNDNWQVNTPYGQLLDQMATLAPPNNSDLWVGSVFSEPGSLSDVQSRVREKDWEGLVVYRPDYNFSWRLDGPGTPTPRPDGAYKWKPQAEGDFLTGAPRPSIKRPGRLKDIMLYQYSPDGRLFECGRLGGFSRPIENVLIENDYKTVMEVIYDGRTPSGKLYSPRFVRFRDDKLAEQCYAPKSWAEAKYVTNNA